MKLWCDNKAAEYSSKVSGSNKLRHIPDLKEHYVRQCVDKGFVNVFWIKSKEQIADVFTKPLPFNLHVLLTNSIMNVESNKN